VFLIFQARAEFLFSWSSRINKMTAMLNWFNKGQKSQLPEPTALQVLRAKQIEQLRHIGFIVAEIQRDVEYRVSINDLLSLHVVLPPQFPQEKPVLRITPGIVHPWVNDQMIVTGCSSVNSFKAHSDLGKVVKEVVEEFRQNPPPIAAVSVSYKAPTSTMSNEASTKQIVPQPSSSSSWQPYSVLVGNVNCVMPDSFPGLEDLTAAEIRSLFDNEEDILKHLEPYMQVVEYNRAESLQALEVSAQENIVKQTQLEERKRIILEKHETLNNLRHRLDELLQLQEERRKKYELCLLQDNLKVASLEADERAESFADKFLDGKTSVEEFRKNYMTARIQYHQRRVMEDKVAQLSVRQPSNHK